MFRTLRWVPFVVLAACSWEGRVKRLSEAEFSHYYALKPFMTDPERKAYLKGKTEEARDAWLKANGCRDVMGVRECYWDRFYKYDAKQRTAIVEGAVKAGWTKEMVYMAWGAPCTREKVVGRQAPRSERLVYRFEKHADGTVLVYEPNSKTAYKSVARFRREVVLDDDRVAEITDVPGWSP